MTSLTNEFGQPIGPPVPGWSPRARPRPTCLSGTDVRVEALTPEHVPGLFAGTCSAADTSAWTYLPEGPFADETGLRAYLQPMWDSGSWSPVAIVGATSEAVLGMATYMRIKPAVGAVEVGSVMFGPRLTRTRGATEAMWLMARHVFEDLGYRRYEWKTDALNTPSCRAAQRLGFSYEGTWRNATIYKGRSRDTAWFAMTDDDWRALRPLYDEWLASAGDTGQRESLSRLTRPLLHATVPA